MYNELVYEFIIHKKLHALYTRYTRVLLVSFLLIKKRRYFILLKQPLIWSVCLWCAFWCCFVWACVRVVWVSFSSFVCRSSWSFFVCVAFRARFRSFRVEFWIRVSLSSLLSNFEFEFLVSLLRSISRFSCRVLNSNLSSKFLVEIFDVLLYSTSRISLWIRRRIRLLEFRCSIRLLEFRFEFAVEISRRNFRFVVLFDFSNFVARFDFSNFDFSIRVLDSSVLNFEFVFFVVLIYSTSRTLICNWWFQICRRNCRLRAEFLVWVLNWTIQFSSKMPIFCAKLRADVAHYSRTIALASLSLPRELCARFSCVKY